MLVAYDGSKGAEFALEDLRHAGLPSQMWVKVLTVVNQWVPPDALKGEPSLPEYTPVARLESRRQAILILKDCRALARKACLNLKSVFPDWKIQPIARVDTPGWAILKAINEWRPDMVVIGSHSHSLLHRFFLGSVSQKITAEAACSVHVARPYPHRHEETRIIIAVDGSADSIAAVQEVRRREWPAGTKFRLVSIIDPKSDAFVTWPALFPECWTRSDESYGEWVTQVTSCLTESLRSKQLDIEVLIFDGDPKARLLAEINDWKAGLVFIGAQGLHHGSRAKLGSLASEVATLAACSVEIIRPEINSISTVRAKEPEGVRQRVPA